MTICTASGARQRSVKPSAHSGPGSRIFGPGPRPRPLRFPMPDHLSPVPACVRASRSPGFRRWNQARDALYAQVADHLIPPGRLCLIGLASPGSGSTRQGWPDDTAACRTEWPTTGWRSARPTSVPGATRCGFGNSTGCRPGRARWRGRQRRAGSRHACTTKLHLARYMSERALDASGPRPKCRATPSAPLAGTAPLAGERWLCRVPAGTATGGVRGL